MQHEPNWDTLRFILAAVRKGNLSAAAKVLKVNRSTVLRRLREFEQRLGSELFIIDGSGLSLTVAGEELMQSALRVEDEMASLHRQLTGREREMSGTIRISTTVPLGYGLLQPFLRDFRAAYPLISLQVMGTLDGAQPVARHEADVAFRTVSNPRDGMEGVRLCSLAVSIYASRDYLERRGRPANMDDLDGHDLIAEEGSLDQYHFIDEPVMTDQPNHAFFSSNTLMFHLAAARAGVGMASLPCYLAEAEPGLVRVFPGHSTTATDLWLMTHPGMRRLARIRSFMEFMQQAVSAQKDGLEN